MPLYSPGLCIGKAINLKIKDIDSQRMQIKLEQGKSKQKILKYAGIKAGIKSVLLYIHFVIFLRHI